MTKLRARRGRAARSAARPVPRPMPRGYTGPMHTASFVQRSLAAFGIGLLALALPVQAQWKWKDERGQVQYSDLPPPKGTPPERILQRPQPAPPPLVRGASAPLAAASAPAAGASAVDPALDARRKQAEQDEAARRQAEEARAAQVRAANCERARSALRTLEGGTRIARTNDKGEREFLDDAQRARETQEARQVVQSDCR